MPRFEIFSLWSSDHYVLWNDSSWFFIPKHYPEAQFLESKMDMSFAIRYARNDGCGPIGIKNTSLMSLITLSIISVFWETVQNPDQNNRLASDQIDRFQTTFKIRSENLNSNERAKMGVFILKRAKISIFILKWILSITWWVNQSLIGDQRRGNKRDFIKYIQ